MKTLVLVFLAFFIFSGCKRIDESLSTFAAEEGLKVRNEKGESIRIPVNQVSGARLVIVESPVGLPSAIIGSAAKHRNNVVFVKDKKGNIYTRETGWQYDKYKKSDEYLARQLMQEEPSGYRGSMIAQNKASRVVAKTGYIEDPRFLNSLNQMFEKSSARFDRIKEYEKSNGESAWTAPLATGIPVAGDSDAVDENGCYASRDGSLSYNCQTINNTASNDFFREVKKLVNDPVNPMPAPKIEVLNDQDFSMPSFTE